MARRNLRKVRVEEYANLRDPEAKKVYRDEMVALGLLPESPAWWRVKHLMRWPERGWPYFPAEHVQAALDILFRAQHDPAGYIGTAPFAALCGVTGKNPHVPIYYAVSRGVLTPDEVTARGRMLWRKDRLKEHIAAWHARHQASPTWEKEVVVITPFGMIRPAREPSVEVLSALILQPLNEPSRRFSPRKKGGYNLKDLTDTPSRRDSTTIFVSTSVKSVQTRNARHRRSPT